MKRREGFWNMECPAKAKEGRPIRLKDNIKQDTRVVRGGGVRIPEI